PDAGFCLASTGILGHSKPAGFNILWRIGLHSRVWRAYQRRPCAFAGHLWRFGSLVRPHHQGSWYPVARDAVRTHLRDRLVLSFFRIPVEARKPPGSAPQSRPRHAGWASDLWGRTGPPLPGLPEIIARRLAGR